MRHNSKLSSISQVAEIIALHLILVTLCLEVVGGVGVESSDHQHLYTDSFPKNDEYNMMALEPRTAFGTPYGGFSRATASRLASLPLKLPSIAKEMQGNSDDGDGFEPMYTTMRDHFGREFACRVFHEDELEARSLGDSMFDTPILKKKEKNNSNGDSNNPSPSEQHNEESNPGTGNEESHEKRDASEHDEDDSPITTATTDDSASQKLSEMGFDPIMLQHVIHQRLTKLTGMCAQLHPPGWWSYEWCHQESTKQFHIEVSKDEKGKHIFDLESVTTLGSYSGRRIEIPANDGGEDTNDKKDEIDLSEERKEIGRVVDTFLGGDTCLETGKPRVTEATFRCCSERYLTKTKGGVLKSGNQVDTDIVSIYEATEDNEAVCRYNVTLCTPLLCDDYDDGTGNGASKATDKKSNGMSALEKLLKKSMKSDSNNQINQDIDPSEVENMSVVEIFQRTLGEAGAFCIAQRTGNWWSYEFCPGAYIRQFHEEATGLTEQFTGMTATQRKTSGPDVTEYFLGRFIAKDHEGVTKENEWEQVVNATSSSQGGSESKLSVNNQNENNQKDDKAPTIPFTNAGGNGAYYFQEYTKGDICDDVDVTDSAIKAGEFGEGGIERAITVRYACNDQMRISVKEDSTCHYVIDITVPALCHHPLFKAPVSKRQVVKCLPISS